MTIIGIIKSNLFTDDLKTKIKSKSLIMKTDGLKFWHGISYEDEVFS